jgi:hypothetical protein
MLDPFETPHETASRCRSLRRKCGKSLSKFILHPTVKIAVNVCRTTLTTCDLSAYAHEKHLEAATVSEIALTVTGQYLLEFEWMCT